MNVPANSVEQIRFQIEDVTKYKNSRNALIELANTKMYKCCIGCGVQRYNDDGQKVAGVENLSLQLCTTCEGEVNELWGTIFRHPRRDEFCMLHSMLQERLMINPGKCEAAAKTESATQMQDFGWAI